MVDKRNWKIFKVRSGDTSRHITMQNRANRRLESLHYDEKTKTLKIVRNCITGWENCCFDIAEMENGTRGMPYHKVNDIVECYKFNIDGRPFYVPLEAFNGDYHDSKLNMCKACQDGVVYTNSETAVDINEAVIQAIDYTIIAIKDRCPAVKVTLHDNSAHINLRDNNYTLLFILSPYTDDIKKKDTLYNYQPKIFYSSSYMTDEETVKINTVDELLQALENIVKALYAIDEFKSFALQLDTVLSDLYINL